MFSPTELFENTPPPFCWGTDHSASLTCSCLHRAWCRRTSWACRTWQEWVWEWDNLGQNPKASQRTQTNWSKLVNFCVSFVGDSWRFIILIRLHFSNSNKQFNISCAAKLWTHPQKSPELLKVSGIFWGFSLWIPEVCWASDQVTRFLVARSQAYCYSVAWDGDQVVPVAGSDPLLSLDTMEVQTGTSKTNRDMHCTYININLYYIYLYPCLYPYMHICIYICHWLSLYILYHIIPVVSSYNWHEAVSMALWSPARHGPAFGPCSRRNGWGTPNLKAMVLGILHGDPPFSETSMCNRCLWVRHVVETLSDKYRFLDHKDLSVQLYK